MPRDDSPPASLPVDSDVSRSDRMPWHGRFRRVLRRRWDILLAIAFGGALGSLARYGVSVALPHPDSGIAWATGAVNVTGAFLLGIFMMFVLEVWASTRLVRPFFGVGVLGGYTTFSTYMLDTRGLLTSGEPARAGGYLFGTLLLGLGAVWCGVMAARLILALLRTRYLHRGQRVDLGTDGGSKATR